MLLGVYNYTKTAQSFLLIWHITWMRQIQTRLSFELVFLVACLQILPNILPEMYSTSAEVFGTTFYF